MPAAEDAHQNDGHGVEEEKGGGISPCQGAQALDEEDAGACANGEGHHGGVDKAKTRVGDTEREPSHILAKIRVPALGKLGLFEAWGEKACHNETGNEQKACERVEMGFIPDYGEQVFAKGGDDAVGQKKGDGKEGKAPGALPWGNAAHKNGNDACGKKGQEGALKDAKAKQGPLEEGRGRIEILVAEEHARADKQGGNDDRQLVALQEKDYGAGTRDKEGSEQDAKQKASPVRINCDLHKPLLEAVVDGKVAVAEKGKKEEQDKVQGQQLLGVRGLICLRGHTVTAKVLCRRQAKGAGPRRRF